MKEGRKEGGRQEKRKGRKKAGRQADLRLIFGGRGRRIKSSKPASAT